MRVDLVSPRGTSIWLGSFETPKLCDCVRVAVAVDMACVRGTLSDGNVSLVVEE